jgi:predicted ATPase
LQCSAQALAYAQDPFSRAYALFWTALPLQCCGCCHTVSAQAEEAVALSAEHGFTTWQRGGMVLQGWAWAQQGRAEQGQTQIHQALVDWPGKRPRPYLLALLGETYITTGQIAQALRVLDAALAETARDGEQLWEAELHRLKGEGLLAQKPRPEAEAEACFQQALTIAVGQQAKALELRAAVSLSRLWQEQGQYERAVQLLAPRYAWFTEGGETADITEAKVLLQELGAQLEC